MKSDLEISKALALAIGWQEKDIYIFSDRWTEECVTVRWGSGWRVFDYRDWAVIGPIAERYKLEVDFGLRGAMHLSTFIWYYRYTVQEAIAACVIEGVKK